MTMPRILGYAFNPVSFWFCFDAGKGLRAVLAEVNNTFGERHCYLCFRDDRGCASARMDAVQSQQSLPRLAVHRRGRRIQLSIFRAAGTSCRNHRPGRQGRHAAPNIRRRAHRAAHLHASSRGVAAQPTLFPLKVIALIHLSGGEAVPERRAPFRQACAAGTPDFASSSPSACSVSFDSDSGTAFGAQTQ